MVKNYFSWRRAWCQVGPGGVSVSKSATVVGALSAIVTLVDYVAAKSFLSHWLQGQMRRDSNGWQISPTLNVLLIAGLVAAVWLLTESPASEPVARKRLFRLRTNLIVVGLVAWFFFGPAIGDAGLDPSAPPLALTPKDGGVESSLLATEPSGPPMHPANGLSGNSAPGPPALAHGHTSQFTWHRVPRPTPSSGTWKPGDGLRAMARLFDDASATPAA